LIRLRTLLILLLVIAGPAAQATSVAEAEGERLLLPNGKGGYITWVPHSDMVAEIAPGTMRLSGPIAAPTWTTSFTFQGVGRNGRITSPWVSNSSSSSDTSLTWIGDHVQVEYLLEREGLRQNFILPEREQGVGTLEVHIDIRTPHVPSIFGGDLLFHDEQEGFVHAYKGLAVWDANGTPLKAWFKLEEGSKALRIMVDDEHAVYPVTVDPVSTTVERQLNNLGVSKFGRCASSAGDLNGDGYSDVVVGAPFDNLPTGTTPGAAYVYYGSASGIGAAPNVTLTSGLVGIADNFGLGVDGAGDVNGDGFEDLIVGSSTWRDNAATPTEGGVFIYHGSATGIATTPNYILQNNTNASYMGSSVAGLGDINGDGFSDIIAGGWLATYGPTSNEGAAWIFLGSATGLNPVFRHRLEQNFGGAQFGYAVGAAGDVNGDGFNDVVIGAHKIRIPTAAPAITGGIYIYHGSANALGVGLNPPATLTFTTTGYSTRNGWSVGSAGDVNGDGYSDVIISDWQDQVGPEVSEGAALIYHGSATGLSNIPATVIDGGLANRYFGHSSSTAGDVNGDGYADVIIGCLQWANGQSNEGAAFLHLGSPTGISSSAFLRYETNIANAFMGEWVSTAGDVNGDGFSDMIVGAPSLSGGRAFIYHGGTYNVSTTPATTRSSGIANAQLGSSVANAGDINGDGYSDAIVGAPGAANGQAGEGLAYVHYGSLTGLPVVPSLTLEVNVAGAAFGSSVASAGDVNGDGYADVVVGAPQSGGIGRAYIFHGGPGGLNPVPVLTLSGTSGSLFGTSVFKAGDHNVDGYSDVIIGAPGADLVFVYPGSGTGLVATPVIFSAPVAGGSFGASVCTAGDVNGDGFSDMIVGAPELSNGQALEGAFYVYIGALITLPTTPAYAYESNVPGRRLGASVAGAGDVNGDGFYDIIAGAPNATNPETNEGIVYAFYGSPNPGIFTASTFFQSNSVNARFGTSVAEAGDVNGDGYADVVVGGAGFTNGEANEGRAWVYLGGTMALQAANNTTLEPNIANEAFGTAVAGGGDVDGDGYSDVIIGSPNAAPTAANEGTVRAYRGNNALAYNRLTRQYMVDLVSPLATNSADFLNRYFFGIGHRARSPMQRTTGRLRWEVVHEGQPFSGTPITNSVSASAVSVAYSNLGLSGLEIKEVVTKIPSRYRNRWRVRVEYPMHKSFDGQRFSRWFYGYASGVGDIGVLPIELISFRGMPMTEGNQLQWSTGSEQNSSHFLVEHSTDGDRFAVIGSVDAAGTSARTVDYRFLDVNAPNGISYYRLRLIDLDGTEEYSDVVAVMREQGVILLYPVPVDDALFWSPLDEQVTHVLIHDALGRTLVDAPVQGHSIQGRSLEQLATGTYSLLLLDEHGATVARSRFLKR